MKMNHFGKVEKPTIRHKAEVSGQTGFPSAATHYMEPTIDLNKELIRTKDATFYVRVTGNNWSKFSILNNDVLIIDRSLIAQENDVALVVQKGAFNIVRITHKRKQDSFILWGIVTYIIHRAR